MSNINNIKAFNHCSSRLQEDEKDTIIQDFINGISGEWNEMTGDNFIHLEDAINWVTDYILSKEQLRNKYNSEKKKIMKEEYPFFERGTHWCTYTPKKEKKPQLYLTLEGFTYWAMGSNTPKSFLIRYWISRQHVRRISPSHVKCSPIKKRKRDNVVETPPRKNKEKVFQPVKHFVLEQALMELEEIRTKNTEVYFIWDGEAMKIGLTTKGANKRIKQLQTGNSKNLEIFRTVKTDNPFVLERFLHDVFGERRVRGEWFSVSSEEVSSLVRFLKG